MARAGAGTVAQRPDARSAKDAGRPVQRPAARTGSGARMLRKPAGRDRGFGLLLRQDLLLGLPPEPARMLLELAET